MKSVNIYKAEKFIYVNDEFKPTTVLFFQSYNVNHVTKYIVKHYIKNKVNYRNNDLRNYKDYHYTVLDYIDYNGINVKDGLNTIWRINKMSKDDIIDYDYLDIEKRLILV